MTTQASFMPVRKSRSTRMRGLALATALTTAFIVGVMTGATGIVVWAILSGG